MNLANNKVTAENFAEFITLVYQSKINSAAAQVILKEMIETGADPSHVMEDKDLSQMSGESELGDIIKKVIEENPEQVEQYKQGKEAIIKYLLGVVMRETKGKADPNATEKLLKEALTK